MVGRYGVISYLVSRRRNEFGIRSALGSDRARIITVVMREAAHLLMIGSITGAAISVLATRSASSFLFGLESWDPPTLVFALASLSGVAALASFLPAFRAARLDPVDALRRE